MGNEGTTGDGVSCNFCGKHQKQVAKIIAGKGVYICNECVWLCVEIIGEDLGGERAAAASPEPPENPDEIEMLRSLGRRLSGISAELAGVIHRLEARRVVDSGD